MTDSFSNISSTDLQADRDLEYRSSVNTAMHGATAESCAKAVESTQWRQYRKGTGHGYAAEDANALDDKLLLHRVDKTGRDNSFRGPDRITGGQPIQTKYYQSARRTVNAAFTEPNGCLGEYQYPGQVLEVPADQYAEALEIMAEKISKGAVPGVSDPNEASLLVRRGSVTYEQAVKIAKAGNVESLKFDIRNNMVSSAAVGGISAAISFVRAKSEGKSTGDALEESAKSAAYAGIVAMATGVATQQFLRTAAGRTASAFLESTGKQALDAAMKTAVGRTVVEKTATAVAGKAVAGTAARNILTRTASTNVVTGMVVGLITAIPDTIRFGRGKISGKEYGTRLAENAAGVGSGVGGSWAGAAIGSCICPGIGTLIGGLLGGIAGGITGSTIAGKILR